MNEWIAWLKNTSICVSFIDVYTMNKKKKIKQNVDDIQQNVYVCKFGVVFVLCVCSYILKFKFYGYCCVPEEYMD